MRLQISIYKEVEGMFLRERIGDIIAEEGVVGTITYHCEPREPKDTRIVDWDTGKGTIPILQPEICSPYGEEPIGYLCATVEGAKDELQIMRRLSLILNERPIVFPKDRINGMKQAFAEWYTRQPFAGSIRQLEYWNAVHSSWRILDRAFHELSILNQFIHLWRSFNALYTYYYKADTGKDPHKSRVSEEAMFNCFLQRFFPSNTEARPVVWLFLSIYDLRWLLDLELDAKRMTKEGYLELIEKGVIQKIEPPADEIVVKGDSSIERKQILQNGAEHQWLFEGVDWKGLLNFRRGLDFWKYHERNDHPSALKELMAFIYDTARNKVFHGSEPFFTEEEIAFYHASTETLYTLLMASLPKVLERGVG